MNVLKRCAFGIGIIGLATLSVQCKSDKKMDATTTQEAKDSVTIVKSDYGTTPKGEKIESYKLKNQNGMEVDIITFGGIITDLLLWNNT